MDDIRIKIQAVLDEKVNPALQAHGGAVQMVDYVNEKLLIRFEGGCQGCAMSLQTLKMGVEGMLRQEFPQIKEIIDTTDHARGENPFF